MNDASLNWNTLTLGLYQDLTILAPIRAVINQYDGTLLTDDRIIVHKMDEIGIRFEIVDVDGNAVDITNFTFKFYVRERYYDRKGKTILKKESGSGIISASPSSGFVTVNLVSNDTKNTNVADVYEYELEMRGIDSRLTVLTGDFFVRGV